MNYTVDSAARLLTALDGNGAQYVTNATYWANGAEFQQWMPNIYFSTTLNNRLQVSGLYSDNGVTASYFMDKTYHYAAGQNNGNIVAITNNNKDTSRTQTFTYDNLNRITSGWSTADTGALSWGENYVVDPWGNLMTSPMLNKVHGGNFQCAGDPLNHATCLSYDAAGNVTVNSPASYVYDQENRIASTAGMTYVYDANGNRVEKIGGGSGTLYWYGATGILAESDLAGNLKSEYVFFNGKRMARIDSPGNSVHYYLSDHLNSTSMVVSAAGITEEESDYSPFGTEYPVISSGANHYKFTGKERDAETCAAGSCLDYFGARYYSNGLGRFITPDWAAKPAAVPYAVLGDPQSLNLYSYVRNIPTTRIDADGHVDILVIENGPTEGNPIGHTAIAVSGQGVFSFGNSTPLGSKTTTYLSQQSSRRDTTVYVIKTTPEQDKAAVNAALQQDKKGTVNVYPDNCSNRANSILDAAGIPPAKGPVNPAGPMQMPGPDPAIPGTAGQRAQQMQNNKLLDPGTVQTIPIPKGSTVPDSLKQFNPGPNQNPQLPKPENKRPAEHKKPDSSS